METSSNSPPLDRASLFLERVTQIRFALLIASFVIAADLALLLTYSRGILTVGKASIVEEIGLGAIAVFFSFYLLAMAAGASVIRMVVESFLQPFLDAYFARKKVSDHSIYGSVRLSQAERYARMERDWFWIALVNEKKQAVKRSESERIQTAGISFCCGLLILLAYFVEGSLLQIGLRTAVGIESVWSFRALGVLTIGAAWFPWLLYLSYPTRDEWIPHPELAKKLRMPER